MANPPLIASAAAAGPACPNRPPRTVAREWPVDRPRQLNQCVVQIDDRIKPRAQQITLTAVAPFLWSQSNPHTKHRATTESQVTFARNPVHQPCYPANSTASGCGQFFT